MSDAHAQAVVETAEERSRAAASDHQDGAAHHHEAEEHEEHGREWLRVGFVALVIILVWSRLIPRYHGVDYLALAGILIGGFPIFKEAFADLFQGRMTMELSMTIALVAASAIGEFFTALLITIFVLIAEIIEGMTVGRGRGAIKQLLDLLPHSVEVRSDGQVAPRDLASVRIGDVVLVRPGGHVPVDGVVVSGHSFVDQANITGESMPAEKIPGARVFAGTMNQSGVLEIQTDKVGDDTAFGRIIDLVERAERSRAPIEKIGGPSGRISGLFRAGLRGPDLLDHARRPFHHFRNCGRGRLRHCGRHPAGDSRRDRAGGAEGRDHQRRPISGRSQ